MTLGNRGGANPCQRLGEEDVLIFRPDRDADRARRAEARRGPHDDALAQQGLEQRARVLGTALGEDEVAARGPAGVEAVPAQRLLARRSPARVLGAPASQLAVVVEA